MVLYELFSVNFRNLFRCFSGFYLYDLDSTHGTYHNKQKCFPKTYYRVRVGHTIKFGGSTRLVILQGPEEDMEEESDLSMTVRLIAHTL